MLIKSPLTHPHLIKRTTSFWGEKKGTKTEHCVDNFKYVTIVAFSVSDSRALSTYMFLPSASEGKRLIAFEDTSVCHKLPESSPTMTSSDAATVSPASHPPSPSPRVFFFLNLSRGFFLTADNMTSHFSPHA